MSIRANYVLNSSVHATAMFLIIIKSIIPAIPKRLRVSVFKKLSVPSGSNKQHCWIDMFLLHTFIHNKRSSIFKTQVHLKCMTGARLFFLLLLLLILLLLVFCCLLDKIILRFKSFFFIVKARVYLWSFVYTQYCLPLEYLSSLNIWEPCTMLLFIGHHQFSTF